MPRETHTVTGEPFAAAEHHCPRCGSAEVRRLSLIHQAGWATPTARNGKQIQSALSKYAAPPSRKHAFLWALLSITATLMMVVSLTTRPGVATVLLGVVTALAAGFAVRAGYYNARVYPKLSVLYARSFMCARCGEISSV